MTRPHDPHARVVTAFVRIPAPLEPGKARCNGCSAVVSVTKNGWLRKHRTPAGEPCAYRANYRRVKLDEIPDVQLPGKRPGAAYGECRECGRWLPGERTLCGQCAWKRDDDSHGTDNYPQGPVETDLGPRGAGESP